ncbi:uncharacterized protein I303_101544 [Kwoniella dejecticola CBS 10117]|uniref:Uncharacterized protein n=1 Tax=Kwoniella dejecticola CBS 10117 TaxID=1296121 RepID=A0A1A6ADG4_9TREE|nr:uncharacterized protein I303_02324 [Kwoniella dejecticola CBS 10117]OBR88105.1 hypothetical protein I303_02324 [Kwoniella dejecticola CBS 10117]
MSMTHDANSPYCCNRDSGRRSRSTLDLDGLMAGLSTDEFPVNPPQPNPFEGAVNDEPPSHMFSELDTTGRQSTLYYHIDNAHRFRYRVFKGSDDDSRERAEHIASTISGEANAGWLSNTNEVRQRLVRDSQGSYAFKRISDLEASILFSKVSVPAQDASGNGNRYANPVQVDPSILLVFGTEQFYPSATSDFQFEMDHPAGSYPPEAERYPSAYAAATATPTFRELYLFAPMAFAHDTYIQNRRFLDTLIKQNVRIGNTLAGEISYHTAGFTTDDWPEQAGQIANSDSRCQGASILSMPSESLGSLAERSEWFSKVMRKIDPFALSFK